MKTIRRVGLLIAVVAVILTGCNTGPEFISAGRPNRDWAPVYADFDGIAMVQVPAGCFVLGRNDGPTEESPAREVCLTRFWIGQFEITNAQYARCVDDGVCTPPAERTAFNDPARLDHPVVNVTWDQAQAFAEWAGGALPTEAQWEYAARGPQGLSYPWGFAEPACERAITLNCGDSPAAVGPEARELGISWIGAQDMAGNVWEWTTSWYEARSYVDIDAKTVNPVGPTTGNLRVLRGGAFNEVVERATTTYRARHTPRSWSAEYGFRIIVPGDLPED